MSIVQSLLNAGVQYAVRRVAIAFDAKAGAADRKKGWHGAGSGKSTAGKSTATKSTSGKSTPPKHEPMLKLAAEHVEKNRRRIIEAQRDMDARISDARRLTTDRIEFAGRQ